MNQLTFTGKERVGRVTVERFRDSIRLRWTLQGKTYSLTVGLDSKDTIKAARAKAQTIDSDITFERFDASLVKYGKAKPTVMELVSPIQDISLMELWNLYLEDKLPSLKAKTVEKHENFTKLFKKLGHRLSYDALEAKQALLEVTTTDRTRDALMYLSACCSWGMKHSRVRNNPFEGMANDMPKPRYQTDPTPESFTREERDHIIKAFKTDTRPGMNYRHYASFVEFLFLTGCRPSEAIGLTWEKIADDCSSILFDCSIQTLANGSRVHSQGSKNNKSRKIAVSPRLQELLKKIKPEDVEPTQLVFYSPESSSQPINYRGFARRAWPSIVDPIKPDTTPYNCRDTFITMQLLQGTPTTVVAKWCDTSTSMIDKNYADKLKLSQLRPTD